MRVRISYSVDLKDVPKECARMLQENLERSLEVHREIESLIRTLGNIEYIDETTIAWEIKDKISRCRQQLARLDSALADNDMIIEGYYSATNKEEVKDVVGEG